MTSHVHHYQHSGIQGDLLKTLTTHTWYKATSSHKLAFTVILIKYIGHGTSFHYRPWDQFRLEPAPRLIIKPLASISIILTFTTILKQIWPGASFYPGPSTSTDN